MTNTYDLPTSSYALHGHVTDVNGIKFKVIIERDEDHGAPWEEGDGHGPVSDWTRRDKAPNERVLHEDHGSKRYYDFAKAVRIARKDGWDADPIGTGTKGETAARAAEADFKRMQSWCNDQWYYVGVIVTQFDSDGDETCNTHSLWGIESDCDDYLAEVAGELIDDCLATIEKQACSTAVATFVTD